MSTATQDAPTAQDNYTAAVIPLHKGFRQLAKVCAKDPGRFALVGIRVTTDPEKGIATFAATNGRILLRATVSATGYAPEMILDGSAWWDAFAGCKAKDDVTLSFPDGYATAVLSFGGRSVSIPTIDGTYPEIDDVIPAEGAGDDSGSYVGFGAVLLPQIVNAVHAVSGRGNDHTALRFQLGGPRGPTRIDTFGGGSGPDVTGVIMPVNLA